MAASTISSPPADGGALQTWTDTAGSNDQTQTTSGNRPTYRSSGAFLPSSKPVVEFTRATPTWMTGTGTGSGTMTRFYVVRIKALGAASHTLSTSTSPGLSGYEPYITSAGKVQVDIPNVASLGLPAPSTIAISTWYVIAFDGNGSNPTHTFINGAAEGTSSTAGTATATSLAIGARTDGTSAVDGYIAEILDYSRVLQPWERVVVDSYCQEEYGITVSDYEATPTLEPGPAVTVHRGRPLG